MRKLRANIKRIVEKWFLHFTYETVYNCTKRNVASRRTKNFPIKIKVREKSHGYTRFADSFFLFIFVRNLFGDCNRFRRIRTLRSSGSARGISECRKMFRFAIARCSFLCRSWKLFGWFSVINYNCCGTFDVHHRRRQRRHRSRRTERKLILITACTSQRIYEKRKY